MEVIEIRSLYFKILTEQHNICVKHQEKYNLCRPYYNALQDAITCALYYINEHYPNNEELLIFAKEYEL